MRTRLHTWLVVLLVAFPMAVRAGGPLLVAGSGFDSGLAGKPLTWAGGDLSYYTDQGDLSPVLHQYDADQFVADALARWTSVSTAAISTARVGQLDENVSGDNVTRAGTVLSMPADIQPDSAKAFGIVYDADGRVIEALLGVGASGAQYCASNAVIGGPDRFTGDGHIAHALLIINGNCAQTSADLPLLRYVLVRMIGRALGLDWSQLNDNVATGTPSPTMDDQAGTLAATVISVTRGGEVVRDLAMQQASADPSDSYEPNSFDKPGIVPGAGHWGAALGYYGDIDWHTFGALANRSFTLDITAVDESGAGTARKALPVIGLWAPGAEESAGPLASQTWLNVAGGTTRMQATILSDGAYKLGIGDARGDGRPDFRYRARLLYAATVDPTRAAAGTVLRITGMGFAPEIKVTMEGAEAPVLSYEVDELLVSAPALTDGAKDITLTDPATGATAVMRGAVTYGGASGAKLQLLLGSNPPVPVGTQAPNPFRVRVLAADGVTAVSGTPVTFTSSSAAVSLLPCNLQTCVVASDGAGEADVGMMVGAAGSASVTATLADGDSKMANVSGVAGTLQISAVPPRLYVAAKTTASVPLLARVVGNGAPLSGRLVEFQVMLGSATLTTTSATTNTWGEARASLSAVNLVSEIRVSACVSMAPQTACDIFYVYPVAANGGVQLLKAGGDGQYVPAGQSFVPVAVRVFDMNVPPNSVAGMAVQFHVSAYREVANGSLRQAGEVVTGNRAQPAVISSTDVTVYSDAWGQATIAPELPAGSGAMRVDVQAAVSGAQAVTFALHTLPQRSDSLPGTRPSAPQIP